jgi:hypothetical protein
MRRSSIGQGRYSAIHFQGWLLRQVSCYTLLSGFRLPWPPSCCPEQTTPFMVSNERPLSALTRRLVHPTAPVLLTKIGPLGTPIRTPTSVHRSARFEQDGDLTHLKFENRLRPFRSQYL